MSAGNVNKAVSACLIRLPGLRRSFSQKLRLHNSANVLSLFKAANAIFTLNAGLWLRRARNAIASLLIRRHSGRRQAETPPNRFSNSPSQLKELLLDVESRSSGARKYGHRRSRSR